MKALAFFFVAATLSAQVQPAPGWCSMAHCNNQMTDYVPQAAFGLSGSVYVKNRDTSANGARLGLACTTNGTNFACSYKQYPAALVYYDGDGNILWDSGDLLDSNIDFAAPIVQADGSVVMADDQHIYKFNSNGTVAWSAATPGGQPTSLVTTPNGAIFAGTDQVQVNPCLQNNCKLGVMINNQGSNYTTASVSFSGGACPGAAASATVSNGKVTAVTVTSQGTSCIVPPDVLIQGDGYGAVATALLNSPTPVAVYDGNTGALVGSKFLYVNGSSGPYYLTTNTPCVNNGSHPNRVYVSMSLYTNSATSNNQGALWALDIDPTNLSNPISPAWNFVYKGPSGASPLCVGDNVYFDGAGITPGDNVGPTIFGLQDNGTSPSVLFENSLGPSSGVVTSNFALDPRPVGGFWHQIQNDSKIYHRDFITGQVIESIDVGSLINANGAPPGSYWTSGVFTSYGSADHPYMYMSEHAPSTAAYFAMVDITNASLVFALPIYPGNSPFNTESEEGMSALAFDSHGQPIMAICDRYSGAYFIAEGQGTMGLSTTSLGFGQVSVGSSSAAETITVTNTASSVLNINGVTASGDFSQTNTCSAPLPAGISCTISVTFTPTAAGERSGAISITDNATGSPQTVALSGTGITSQPAISFSSTMLNFASQYVGTTSPAQSVTVTNIGSAPLAFSSVAPSGDAAQNNSCIGNLPPGANCTVNVMFVPKATGARSGTITLTDSASDSPQTIALSGTGAPTPSAAAGLSTTSLIFRAQAAGTTSSPITVRLTNPGTSALSIAGIVPSGDVAATTTCGATLGPGASCTISVAFAPAAVGQRTGTVTLNDSAPDSPQSIVVNGVGLGNGLPLLNPPSAPSSQVAGASGFTLSLTGGGFLPGAIVEWNGAPLATNFVGNTQLTATVPASSVATPGTASLNVFNPGPGGGLSNTQWFPVSTPVSTLVFNLANLPAGAGPRSVATADFNGDGKLDLAVANSGAGTVSILTGHGDGTFSPAVNYAAGTQPSAVAAGDFNGDGKLDLAVADQAGDAIWILLGNGDGTFQPAVAYATGNGPVAVILADFNGDGSLDVAVANQLDNTVSILLSKGNGAFKAHADYPAGQAPTALVASDFNGDGKLDLAVGDDFYGGAVSVLLGNGNGGFQAPAAYPTGDSVALVAADFNGDGKLDLVALNQMQQSLSVLLGNGDGTFQPAIATPIRCGANCQLHAGPASLVVADLSGDGTLELAIVNNSSNTISILESYGDGTFSGLTDYNTAADPVAVITGDFNGDGALDLAVAALTANQVSILMQSPAALFSSTSLNFGNVALGSNATQNVSLTNSGSAPLQVTGITASGPFSQTNNCSTPLPAGTFCSIAVTFTPASNGPASGTLTITDNVPGSPQTISLSGTGVGTGVTLNLASPIITGGNTLTSNTVTLSSPAPAGGALISLASSNPTVASLPASVTVAQGATTSPAFSITTTGVASATPVTLSATYNGVTSNATLTVYAATVGKLNLPQTSVTSGLPAMGNVVILTGQAAPGGDVVTLTSANPAVASVPATVTVPGGSAYSPGFTITTGYVATATPVVISASYGKTMVTATLTVNPVAVAGVSLSPPTVVGGATPASNNTVTLNAPAPPGGAVVTLTSSNPAVASVPASVTVAAGATTSPSFSITTTAVAAPAHVMISATYNSVTRSALLTVNPATPYAVKLSAATVSGGNPVASNQVQLNGPAPSGGATVALSSSNPAVAAVPASVLVPAGYRVSQQFVITTTPVTSSTAVTISATYLGITKSATLTVTP
jgi:FG-GAP-like repeat/Cep192 domain 4/Abnormal spindle-like microcephaly-assoc'd, ASPM-SPD-2-Hydin/HYDIN/CFA65/VesB-like, Ig-like domain